MTRRKKGREVVVDDVSGITDISPYVEMLGLDAIDAKIINAVLADQRKTGGLSRLSPEAIAAKIGVSTATVEERQRKFICLGYLNMTPGPI